MLYRIEVSEFGVARKVIIIGHAGQTGSQRNGKKTDTWNMSKSAVRES